MENEPPPPPSGREVESELHNTPAASLPEPPPPPGREVESDSELDENTAASIPKDGPMINAFSAVLSAIASESQSDSYSPSQSQSQSSSSPPSRFRSPSPPRRRFLSNLGPHSIGRMANTITTIMDIRQRAVVDNDTSDSGTDESQDTGGEESEVLLEVNDADAISSQARQLGSVEIISADHLHPSSSSRSFSGTARLLTGETLSSAPRQPDVVTHEVVIWRNGFTVDGGPLRRLEDPENASFMESIRMSECPKEFQPADKRTKVELYLRRKEKSYSVQGRPFASFQGVSRSLKHTEGTAAAGDHVTAMAPSMDLVDETLPSTSIQLRLSDGERIISRFNYHHSIRDIRGFINAARPGGSRTYQLQTVGFPPKLLDDLDQTIEQAGLANSVVIQKL